MAPTNPLTIALPNGPPFDLLLVPGGPFTMGDDNSEYDDEKPAHPVLVSSFYLGKYPVTQALWQAVMGTDPSHFKGENHPVEQVSWDDTQAFFEKLNALTGRDFRLPTEAEWEYAARGGPVSRGTLYSGSDRLRQVGWFEDNSGGETHDVGGLRPNELGLHDMSGNVWEWCNDRFDEKYYAECLTRGPVQDPQGPDGAGARCYRGGSYFLRSLGCRPAGRGRILPGYRDHNLGLRLGLSVWGLPLQSVVGLP